MNTRNNQRYQETERRLIDALIALSQKKDIEKITVRELCEKTGINRSSFYLHYADVFDMADRIEGQLAAYYGQLFTNQEENYDLGERFMRLFRFVREHQDYYRFYLNRNNRLHVLDAALPATAVDAIGKWAAELGFRSASELQYHQVFFKAGLSALVREWVLSGCVESPQDMAEILSREYHHNAPSWVSGGKIRS